MKKIMIIAFLALACGAWLADAVDNHCAVVHPKPRIRFDRYESSRVYIPVTNWSQYPNYLFRDAPELPPCGANPNAARLWVDVYDADSGLKVYGFCDLPARGDLRFIWFHSTANSGRVYIIFKDRACNKSYKSNTISWHS